MVGIDRCVQMAGQGAELVVLDLVAHETAGDAQRVDARMVELRCAVATKRSVQEARVEAEVVADDHRAPDELEQRREDLVDLRGGQHHRFGDAGEHGDERRDRLTRVHERVEDAEALATLVLHRTDLGDRAVVRRGARGLEIQHDERDLGERGRQVVEAGAVP